MYLKCNQEGNYTIKAKISIDIWGFGVTMYNFFTNSEPLFRCNESYDTLYGEVEKSRLVNWDGLSFEELDKILPGCTDTTLREKAQNFFKKCLHGDINQRHENTEAILDDPLFRVEVLSTVGTTGDNDSVGALIHVASRYR